MTFERTASGQANRAIFFGVDFVCYVEGTDGAEAGHDVAFWHGTLSKLRPDLRIRYTCRGGKPVLEKLARDVISNNISHTLIAMDADYSRFFKDCYIDDPRVLYTHGYSWENDVFHRDYAAKCHARLTQGQAVNSDAENYLEMEWKRTLRDSYWVMLADFFALARNSSVIPRNSPGRLVSKGPDCRPIIRKDQCRILVLQAKKSATKKVVRIHDSVPSEPAYNLVGHAIELVARYIMNSAIIIFGGKKEINADHFHAVSLANFLDLLLSGNAVSIHHNAQASRLPAV